MNTPINLQQLADDLGARIDEVRALPDGSGFATMSMPLRPDHWLTRPGNDVPPMPWRMGEGPARNAVAEKLRDAARYAIRSSTMNGAEDDFDPDAMVQNFIVGMLGYWTADGTSNLCGDPYDNPDPIPPLFTPI
jgi:hypothetical protein